MAVATAAAVAAAWRDEVGNDGNHKEERVSCYVLEKWHKVMDPRFVYFELEQKI